MRVRPAWLCKRLAVGAVVLTAGCGDAFAPTGPVLDPVSAHLSDVLALMERHSVRRLEIDWTSFRARVQTEARDAKTIPDLHPAIRVALGLLGDGHSSYRSASGTVLRVATRTCSADAAAAPQLPANVGYVRVTSFSGAGAEAAAFAKGIQDAIRAADRDGLVGWIVDLRGNGGGNMWPMLAGVGPVLGEGLAGYFVDPLGGRTSWQYRAGAAWTGSVAVQSVEAAYQLRRPNPRVAVLTDQRVASSGEAIAISFRGRPDTRSFGTATCGLSTANSGYPLSDGALLNLTVATMADRAGSAYGDVVAPDEVVAGDGAVARAVAWLGSGPPR